MREFIKQHNIRTKPAPRKRREFEKVIIQNSNLDIVLSAIKSHLDFTVEYEKKKFDESKCRLLAHTLCMTAYHLRDHYQYNERANLKIVAVDSGGTCTVEDKLARKFNSNKTKILPPFFPGDRTSIRYSIQ